MSGDQNIHEVQLNQSQPANHIRNLPCGRLPLGSRPRETLRAHCNPSRFGNGQIEHRFQFIPLVDPSIVEGA
jgi:hypothetical protein